MSTILAIKGTNGSGKSTVVGDLVADKEKARCKWMIFAGIDTPAELCVERVNHRRLEAGNTKSFNPEKLLHKYESILKSQEKLLAAGYDARILPHEEPLQTLLRW